MVLAGDIIDSWLVVKTKSFPFPNRVLSLCAPTSISYIVTKESRTKADQIPLHIQFKICSSNPTIWDIYCRVFVHASLHSHKLVQLYQCSLNEMWTNGGFLLRSPPYTHMLYSYKHTRIVLLTTLAQCMTNPFIHSLKFNLHLFAALLSCFLILSDGHFEKGGY